MELITRSRERQRRKKTLCCLFSSLLRCLEDSLYRDAFGASEGTRRRQEGLFPAYVSTAAGFGEMTGRDA